MKISSFLSLLLIAYVVNVYSQCNPDAGPDMTVCGNVCIFSANLGDINSTGYWSTNFPGTVFSNINDPNSTVTVQISTDQCIDFYWTENNTVIPCTDVDTIKVCFVLVKTKGAGNDTIICGTYGQLNANYNYSGNSGYWTTNSTNITFSNIYDPKAIVYAANAPSTDTLTWWESNGTCVTSDEVIVTFVDPPTADFVAYSTCEDDYAPVFYTGNADSTAVFDWTFNGGLPTSATSMGPHNIFYDDDGTFQVVLTVTDTNGCSSYGSQDIIVVPLGSPNCCVLPIANAGFDDTICGYTYILQAVPSWGLGTWSLVTGPGNPVFANVNDPNTNVIVPVQGVYEFMWLEDNGVQCHDSDYVSMTFLGGTTISGSVLYNSLAVGTGAVEVKLYEYNSGALNLYDVVNIGAMNLYSIILNDPGDYILKAKVLDQVAYPDALDTYYNGAFIWDQAQILTFNCNSSYNHDINLEQMTGFTPFNGKVSGVISYEGSGAPVSYADFFLRDTIGNQILLHTTSSVGGYYEFDNIPIGSYDIMIDLPGIPQISTHNFMVTTTNTLFEHYDFYVDTVLYNKELGTGIYADTTGINNIETTGTEKASVVITYPNPFSQSFNLEYKVEKNCETELQVIDATGKLHYYNACITKKGTYNENIEINNPGIYFLILRIDGDVCVKKLISK